MGGGRGRRGGFAKRLIIMRFALSYSITESVGYRSVEELGGSSSSKHNSQCERQPEATGGWERGTVAPFND